MLKDPHVKDVVCVCFASLDFICASKQRRQNEEMISTGYLNQHICFIFTICSQRVHAFHVFISLISHISLFFSLPVSILISHNYRQAYEFLGSSSLQLSCSHVEFYIFRFLFTKEPFDILSVRARALMYVFSERRIKELLNFFFFFSFFCLYEYLCC